VARAFGNAFNKNLVQSASNKFVKDGTAAGVHKALTNPSSMRGVRAIGNLFNGVVFKKFLDKAAFHGTIGEYTEEWATAVADSFFNLDKDTNVYENGQPKPWSVRVTESLLMPATRTKESLAMIVAFGVVPGVSGLATTIADPVPLADQERNHNTLLRFLNAEDVQTVAELDNMADTFSTIVENEDSKRWYSNIFKNSVWAQSPRQGSLASFTNNFSPGNLSDVYWAAEDAKPGTGAGRAAMRKLIADTYIGKRVETAEQKLYITKLIRDGVIGLSDEDTRRVMLMGDIRRRMAETKKKQETEPDKVTTAAELDTLQKRLEAITKSRKLGTGTSGWRISQKREMYRRRPVTGA
jgi:hypothetical protein